MAYLDLELATGAVRSPASSVPVQLDDLERQAVLISRTDDARSISPRGRIDRVTAVLFGSRPASRLADDRLEAYRRYAVLYRLRGPRLAASETARALQAGIPNRKLELVRAMVDPWHTGKRGRSYTQLAQAVAFIALSVTTYLWLTATLGDQLISMVVLLVSLVTMIAQLSRKGARR